MREKRVIVAIVQDAQGRFLLHFNPKWDGYAFPMKDMGDGADNLGAVAIQAVEDDLGCSLPNGKAEELEYLGRIGRSGAPATTHSMSTGSTPWLIVTIPNGAPSPTDQVGEASASSPSVPYR